MSIQARYKGWCFECGEAFDIGALIEASGERSWRHFECPDDLKLPAALPPACPDCFMVLPCMCGYYEGSVS